MPIYLTHEGVRFSHQVVYLSGNVFLDCVFERASLVLRDGATPVLSNCKINACAWHLDMHLHDHNEWAKFLTNMVTVISNSLPTTPQEMGRRKKHS